MEKHDGGNIDWQLIAMLNFSFVTLPKHSLFTHSRSFMTAIKRNIWYVYAAFAVMMLSQINVLSAATPTEVILLQADNFEHVQFKKIKANRVAYQEQRVQIDVDDSASILMLPFEMVKPINKVSFEWRSEGVPLVKDSQHELKRSGDDAVFKLGLLLQTDDESINPFAPSWLKQVRELLTFPSEEMIYLVVGAKHPAGERWVSPYNKRVMMISVASKDVGEGWRQSSYQFEQQQDVVALWLMADGDNTHSAFAVSIKNIVLEKSY